MNPDRKKRYMEMKYQSDILPPGSLERLFKKVDSFEKRKGKDCSEFNSKEILTFLTMNNDRSLSVIDNRNSMLSNYTDWCLTNGFIKTGQNHYEELTIDDLKRCLNKEKMKESVISRNDLLEAIKELQNPRDQFILLGIFEIGVKRHFADLVNVSIDDFDRENNVLKLTNREVIVSDQLCDLAMAANENLIYYDTRNRAVPLIGDKIIKYTVRGPKSEKDVDDYGKKIIAIVRRNLDYLGLDNMIPRDIAFSGMIHRIKEYGKYYNLEPREVVLNKKLYKKVCQQYDVKMYSTVFLHQYESVLSLK